ncbi:HlyD family secretion protein [Lichenihabitans sp. Uapishka_5]|uniref:HlyD family secretion protein n=1 Tax=Lichenihabitans sp. Uapishka_5 TaxID=3037302 RepID=UPI0029E7D10D|nr:HlyD family secretion protein [Lichenihabitans sp. Uapishka_5]MDX7953548.1 HlyD family secretion protein [Lichenihabitans sp. Uapishka_5]
MTNEIADTHVNERPEPTSSSMTRWVGLTILGVLAALVAWYAVSDRWTPYSNTATVSAYVAQLAPRVSGPVVEVLVQDNARVKAGDELFRIDPTLFEIEVRRTEAELAQALQTNSASSAGLNAAQARVAQAQASLQNVRASSSRILQLVERGVYAASRGDDAKGQLRTAEAELAAAQAQLEQAKRELGQTGAENPQVIAAQAGVQKARTDLINTTVVALTDGLVSNLLLTVGQYATAGQPALTMIDTRGGWIVADFRENQLGNLKPDDVVRIAFDVAPGRIFDGVVESIAWGIDTGRQAKSGNLVRTETDVRWFDPARRIPVRIKLPPLDNLPPNIRVGSKVAVIVNASGTDGLTWWLSNVLLRISTALSYLY